MFSASRRNALEGWLEGVGWCSSCKVPTDGLVSDTFIIDFSRARTYLSYKSSDIEDLPVKMLYMVLDFLIGTRLSLTGYVSSFCRHLADSL